jgi:hypothetical protein
VTLVTKQHLRVQLKRAYAPPRLQKMVPGSSWIASGRAAYASRRRPSIGGSRTWLPAQSYADGSGMIRADGSSSAGDTRLSSLVKLNFSASFGRSRETIRSRSSLRLATSCITKPSFSGTFLQVEPEPRRGGFVVRPFA